MTVGAPAPASGRWRKDDVDIAIAVEDTGIGIAAEALPALFSEFEQADAAVRRRQGGTGLGLAISRRLARAMGGDILVASAPGPRLDVHGHHAAASGGDPARRQAAARRRAGDAAARAAGARPRHRAPRAAPVARGRRHPARRNARSQRGPTWRRRRPTAGEPFTTLIVDGRSGCERGRRLLADARAAAPGGVQGVVVLDTAAKADFAQFRDAGFDAYLVRPVRPQSVLTRVGARPRAASRRRSAIEPERQPAVRRRAARCCWSRTTTSTRCWRGACSRRSAARCATASTAARRSRRPARARRRSIAAYDLVLMDAHMPVLDGLEATRVIKGLYAAQDDGAPTAPPIIAVTANAFDEDRRRCLEAGMDDYLAKPFDRDELHRLLEKWCGDLAESRGGKLSGSRWRSVIADFNGTPVEPRCRSNRRAMSRT